MAAFGSLSDQILKVLRESETPLSSRAIAAILLQQNPNLVPQPIYDPARTYQVGDRLYHPADKFAQWFVVREISDNVIVAEFEDGQQIRLIQGWQECPQFPVTPEEVLARDLETLLPTLDGLHCKDGLWHSRSISPSKLRKCKRSTIRKRDIARMTESPVMAASSTAIRQHMAPEVRLFAQQRLPVFRSADVADICQRLGIQCFYHITHVSNLPSILQFGLLCKNRVPPGYVSIANEDIQAARSVKSIPQRPGLTLHDCVPLFVAPKPPMLSARREQQEAIVYLHLHYQILSLPGVVFTDGNARSKSTQFFDRVEDLQGLDWEVLRANYWGDEDPIQHKENKRRRSAEVLVPGRIPPRFIQRVTTYSKWARLQAERAVVKAGMNIPVQIDPSYFYPMPSASSAKSVRDELLPWDEIPF